MSNNSWNNVLAYEDSQWVQLNDSKKVVLYFGGMRKWKTGNAGKTLVYC